MPTFLVIYRHSPENCGAFNDKARKAVEELARKQDERCKKHGVKIVEEWHVPEEHLIFVVYEAPSLEAFQRYNMEPEVLAMSEYETAEIKIVYRMEEAMKILRARAGR